MQKRELLKLVSKRSGIDEKIVFTVFDELSATIKERLMFGVDIKINNFLNFVIKTMPAKEHYDVLAGVKKHIPKRYKVIVSLPRSFKDKINKKPVY